ncbi:MAG: hypothetical protein II942_01120, partial [Alphaproteobacteria bacterium]|nr:hypothetical protein [Alphaproteobacteria bacterium]
NQREKWNELKERAQKIKRQVQPIFNQFYSLIPIELHVLSDQLKSIKMDKTAHMIALNQIKTEWQSCQEDWQFLLETSYLEVTGSELGQAPQDVAATWDVSSLNNYLDQLVLTARSKGKYIKSKISSFTKGVEILRLHKNHVERDRQKLQENPLLNSTLSRLESYIRAIDIQCHRMLEELSLTTGDDKQYEPMMTDVAVFQRMTHDAIHQNPSIARRLKKLLEHIHQETEQVIIEKAERLKKATNTTVAALTYQTDEEKEERLLKLLQQKTSAIRGEQMDFTFTEEALKDFSKYPDEYQHEAVKKLQRIMNVPLENGSRTIIAGHPAIDKMKDYDIHKIRAINYNIGEDNLPRIMCKPLPSQNGHECWSVVGFSDEARQKRQYARFARRPVKEWPDDPNQIVILNPPQTAVGHGPHVPTDGGHGM